MVVYDFPGFKHGTLPPGAKVLLKGIKLISVSIIDTEV